MPNKTEIRCFKRWLFLKGDIKEEEEQQVVCSSSTQWTPEEDELLKAKVEEYGTQNWVIIARYLKGRLGR